MNPELIRTWLKLPPGPWPPDHYQLLGLARGESNVSTIERHVQERMDLVRRYQVRHPEQATEAMNRIAQAFVSLTDPALKKGYDRSLNLAPPEPAAPASEPQPAAEPTAPTAEAPATTEEAPAAQEPTATEAPAAAEVPADTLDPLAWLYAPAALLPTEPAAGATVADPTPLPAAATEPVAEVSPTPPPAPVVPPPAPPPLTTRDLYRALRRARRVEGLWKSAGKYLGSPKKRVTRQAEARELLEALDGLRQGRADLPAGMGEVGQPGYFVLVLAAQQNLVPTFLTLTGAQRKKLAADWAEGAKRLAEHREELREQAQALRPRASLGRRARRAAQGLARKSTVVLLLLGLLVLNVIIWRATVAVWRG